MKRVLTGVAPLVAATPALAATPLVGQGLNLIAIAMFVVFVAATVRAIRSTSCMAGALPTTRR